ncbi:hypothetical protein [Spirillospora sp. NPDC047279]|uniref:SecDF P1 head subdomain-containing protein n=1 Tax=Spirillospora sp. NPDC047279 TaxID=3155478 RepID=UPI0033ECF4B6
MRVVPRRAKGRPRPEAAEPPAETRDAPGDHGSSANGTHAVPEPSGGATNGTSPAPAEPAAERPSETSATPDATPSTEPGGSPGADTQSAPSPPATDPSSPGTRGPAASGAGASGAGASGAGVSGAGVSGDQASADAGNKASEAGKASGAAEGGGAQAGKRPKQSRSDRRAARKAAKAAKKGKGKDGAAAPAAAATPEAAATLPEDPDQKRRARSLERQRRAAQVKRDRNAQKRPPQETAAREHRSALLVMVITLGLLIAAVAVTGGLIASSMRTRPVTLAAPLHIYPVAATVPGQCQAGTQGISWPTATGPTCYVLTQGIAIRRVADLRLQRGKTDGAYDVALTLRTTDQRAFADLTRAMVGKDLAFVVRDRLVTVPRVEMPISDGKVVITGTNSRAEAQKLLRELKGS